MIEDDNDKGKHNEGDSIDPVAEKLQEIDEKLHEAAAPRFPEPPAWNFKRSKNNAKYSKPQLPDQGVQATGVGLTAMYLLATPTVMGIAAGYLIDNSVKSEIWLPILGLGGAVLGLVAVIIISSKNQ